MELLIRREAVTCPPCLAVGTAEARILPPCRALLRREGVPSEGMEVSLVLCGDAFIQDLNLRWRGLDKPTDVLSFAQEGEAPPALQFWGEETSRSIAMPQGGEEPLSPPQSGTPSTGKVAPKLGGLGGPLPSEPRVLGDIVVSLDTAQRQADAAQWPLDSEVALLTVHGLLHLLGYEDETEDGAALMQQKTAAALQDAGIELPPAQMHPFLS